MSGYEEVDRVQDKLSYTKSQNLYSSGKRRLQSLHEEDSDFFTNKSPYVIFYKSFIWNHTTKMVLLRNVLAPSL